MSDLEESGEITFRPISQQVSSPSLDDGNTHTPTGDVSANVFLLAYRSAQHEATGVSPCEMMLGRHVSLPADLVLGKAEPYPLTVWPIATSQIERVGLDVGGKLFVTTRTTLRNYPKSLLFKLVDDPTIKSCYIRDSLEVYFVDQDPELFNIILHFYRDSVRNVVCHLPTHPEASY